jgi:hypothetical protein
MSYRDTSEDAGGEHAKPTAKVESTGTEKRSLIQLATFYALCTAAFAVLCMPVKANATSEHVFYISSDGHIHELYYIPFTWYADGPPTDIWSAMAPYAADVGSGLTSYYDGSYEHVFYISTDGHVRHLYTTGPGAQWFAEDTWQGQNSIPAALETALTSFGDSSGQEHVFYRTQATPSNSLVHLYSNGPGMSWSGELLNKAMQGVSSCAHANEQSLTSYYGSGSLTPPWNVFYIEFQSHHLCWLYNAMGQPGSWKLQDVTATTPGATTTDSWLTSFSQSTQGGVVSYVGKEGGKGAGDVHMLLTTSGLGWQDLDLTTNAGSPRAAPFGLASFYADDELPILVFYIDKDQVHLHVLAGPAVKWQNTDLTAATNGPWVNAAELTSFLASGYTAPLHVYYRGSDLHVHEAYTNNNHWWGNDPTAATNSPYMAGIALTSLWIP